MQQRIISSENEYEQLDNWLEEKGVSTLFLVCDSSISFLKDVNAHLEKLSARMNIVRFDEFQPNPLYESVVLGVKRFRESGAQAIAAIGGGSAMDTAKCIKLYSNMEGDGEDGNFLKQEILPNRIPFLAMPTTAGTGSEATRYAVIYYEGAKQSIADYSCIPDTVLMDAGVLKTLPAYQKKSTMMDAFCHAIESFWSVNSTEESRRFSRSAIETVLQHMEGYLANAEEGNKGMLLAANLAGKAINITQTTAGHAMCYKLTSLFGVAHGHAAALCDRVLFDWMLTHTDQCIDERGEDFLKQVFGQIADAMGCGSAQEAAQKLADIFAALDLEIPQADEEQFEVLKGSVNPVRLKNHPIKLTEEDIDMLYHKILRVKQ